MKITYNKNPLCSVIELDEHEKKELWYKIKIEELENNMSFARVHLTEGRFYDIEKARAELYVEVDERCDQLLQYALSDLDGYHVGDCTCQPCSCSKCWVEGLLGIDTIEGLGKHSAYKIDNAFGKKNEKTMQEALDYLKNYEPKADWDGYEPHIPRWKAEADAAYIWLLAYAKEHFPDEIIQD